MQIHSLIDDIHYTIQRKDEWFSDELAMDLGSQVAARLHLHYKPREGKGTLRLSKMGPQCPRALWYSIYHPELAEPLPPSAVLKYSYGHILEAQTIALAKASGHEVTGEQDECNVDGIKGHRDCVIDGCVVDVKSASTFSFQKFKDGSIKDSDTFGYLDQLTGYVVGSVSDPLVRCKDRGYLLAVDKQLGHICLYEHKVTLGHRELLRDRIASYKGIVSMSHAPECTCGTEQIGKSGNIGLDTKASYSPYKYCCFPNLRTFIYAGGKPVFLTKVERLPDVVEVNKFGQRVS